MEGDVIARQVNWTLVHGWSFLQEYDSNSEEPTWESDEDGYSNEPDLVTRFKLQEQEDRREAKAKLKAKLLTVLKSPADDEEDEQTRQRIRKKEKRVSESAWQQPALHRTLADPQGVRQGPSVRPDAIDDEEAGSETRWLLAASSAAASASRARDSRGDRREKVSEPPD